MTGPLTSPPTFSSHKIRLEGGGVRVCPLLGHRLLPYMGSSWELLGPKIDAAASSGLESSRGDFQRERGIKMGRGGWEGEE